MTNPDITREAANPERSTGIRSALSTLMTSVTSVALIYLAAVILAEVVTTLIDPRLGLILHGVILFAMLIHATLTSELPLQRLVFSLTLAPLIRLVSLSLPLINFPFVYWYMIVGVPLFMAAFVAARVARVDRKKAGVVVGRSWLVQITIGLFGLGLGYLEYLILRPEPLIPEFSWPKMLLPALVLLIFTGFLEEYIFRGVMQYTAKHSMGWAGLIYISALFAALHIGYKSILDLVFVFAVALCFSLLAYITRSLLGVTLAHGLTNIGLFLIFPFFITAPLPVVTQTIIDQSPIDQSAEITATPGPVSGPALWSAPPTHTPSPTKTPNLTGIGLPSATLSPTATQTIIPTQSVSLCIPPDKWVAYTVQPGDSLAKFRQVFKMRKSALLAANCNEALLEVYVGQIFYLPYLPPTSLPIKVVPQPTLLPLQPPGERPSPEPPSSRP